MDVMRLSRPTLEAMASAGAEVAEIERLLAKSGENPVSEALRDAGVFYEWQHYPAGDVYDPETHAQFFYHAHAPGRRSGGEHGHFHCFLRPRGMAPGALPLVMPELAVADAPEAPADPISSPVAQPNQGGNNEKLSHLVAIAMSPSGTAMRLFTTNRWVTGETWYAAEDVVRMLDRFVVDLARPSWPLNRWLTAMFCLFRPEMEKLLVARDAMVMNWRRRHRGKVHVFEDRRLEVASEIEISVADQRRRIEAALRRAA